MKKQGFIEGTMVGTIATVICKILGLIYVIPFRMIVGSSGGALYGYGYNIYMVFLSLATSGIPIAMSKIISEYNTLEMTYEKDRAYKLGSRLIVSLGFISFIILFICAPKLAYYIIGDNLGGNTIEGVTLVIRIVSTALLIVPIQSVKKGYLQGHKYIAIPQIANVIEQVVRVIVILLGSYIFYKVLNKSLELSVGVAISGATIGAIVSYIFISYKISKNKKTLKGEISQKKLEDFTILKKIVIYALPFILIDLIKSAYNTVDMFTVVRTLTDMGYELNLAEEILADITTWGSKLNMIVTSLVVGLSASLVPNIMSSFVKNDFKDVSKKINQSLEILIILAIPMTFSLSFLSDAVWTIFYGTDKLGASIFALQIFTALSLTFHSVLIDATQTMNDSKMSIGMLLTSFILKCVLNIPLMYLFKSINIEPYYGAIVATLVTQSIVIIVLLINLYKKFIVNYRNSLSTLFKVFISTIIMFIILYVMKLFIPITDLGRVKSLLIVMIYAVVGVTIYLITTIKLHTYDDILTDAIKRKLHLK